jgi:hypothetical protein
MGEQSVQTVKIEITLNTAEEWNLWYGRMQMEADRLNVWQYINPKQTDDQIEVLARPVAPEATASKDEKDDYKERLAEYKLADQNLKTLRSAIVNSVSTTHTSLMFTPYSDTPKSAREMVVTLKTFLAPSRTARELLLRKQYADVHLYNKEARGQNLPTERDLHLWLQRDLS